MQMPALSATSELQKAERYLNFHYANVKHRFDLLNADFPNLKSRLDTYVQVLDQNINADATILKTFG